MTDNPPVRTTIEVNKELWRQFRAEAVLEEADVSEHMETVLDERYNGDE